MINKKKLITGIEKAVGVEDRLVSLLNRHIAATISHSKLKEEEKQVILEKFRSMVVAHTRHTDTLMLMKQEIVEGDSNVY